MHLQKAKVAPSKFSIFTFPSPAIIYYSHSNLTSLGSSMKLFANRRVLEHLREKLITKFCTFTKNCYSYE